MKAQDQLLRVARTGECNTQQTPLESATGTATGTQQSSLKALAEAHFQRNRLRNKCATQLEKTLQQQAPSAAPVLAPIDDAVELLKRFATDRGIDWRAARSQMIDGDASAAVRQLQADSGDGVEYASVLAWLSILVARARG